MQLEADLARVEFKWVVDFQNLSIADTLEPVYITIDDVPGSKVLIKRHYTLTRPPPSTSTEIPKQGELHKQSVFTVTCKKASKLDDKPMKFNATFGRYYCTVRRVITDLEQLELLDYVVAYVPGMFKLMSPTDDQLRLLNESTAHPYNEESREAFMVGIFLIAMTWRGRKLFMDLHQKAPEDYIVGEEETLRERELLTSQDDRVGDREVGDMFSLGGRRGAMSGGSVVQRQEVHGGYSIQELLEGYGYGGDETTEGPAQMGMPNRPARQYGQWL